MGDQPPFDQVKRALARFVVLSNDEELLARPSIVARPDIAHAAVPAIQPLDDGKAKWSRALDHAATHIKGSVERLIGLVAFITQGRNGKWARRGSNDAHPKSGFGCKRVSGAASLHSRTYDS
jgi:hypothetical protein